MVATQAATGLKITRIKNQRTGATNTTDEWILIENVGTRSWDLAGCLITDETDRQRAPHIYTLPRVAKGRTWTLDPGELLFLITGHGTDQYIAQPRNGGKPQFQFFWNRDAFVWNNSGDRVYLRHPNGQFLTQPFPIP